jgi:hypothetical protein
VEEEEQNDALNSIQEQNSNAEIDKWIENEIRPELPQLLNEFKTPFRTDSPFGIPPKRALDHPIHPGNAPPVNRPPYALSASQLQEQTRQIQDLLDRGLMQKNISP